MPGEYIPSFGRPEPPESGEERLEDDGSGGFGKLRVALIPVLDPDAAAAVEEQIRLMVAQAVRDGFDQAMSEMASEGFDETGTEGGGQADDVIAVTAALECAGHDWLQLPKWLLNAYENGHVLFLKDQIKITTPQASLAAGRHDLLVYHGERDGVPVVSLRPARL